MSEMRVSDPSRLHLKRELTQIRKAARLLRDPGTTSSWKSPLSSSRSLALPPPSSSARRASDANGGRPATNGSSNVESDRIDSVNKGSKDRDKTVFLYNWKSHAPSNNAASNNEVEDGDRSSSSSSAASAPGGSLSDAHCNNISSASTLSRRRDANLAVLGAPAVKRTSGIRKRTKKLTPHLGGLTSHAARKNEGMFLGRGRSSVNARALRGSNGHPSVALSSVEQSDDDTEEYSNSEDVRRISGASPLLLKFKRKNWSHSSSKFLRTSRRDDSSYTYSTPALSTSSFNRHRNRNPSTLGSWDGTATSLNEGDCDADDPLDLPGGQGCGIPCYWTKRTPKHTGMCGSCCSPSLSEALRNGSSMLCGSQSLYVTHRRSISESKKHSRIASKSARGVLPLLRNSGDGRGLSSIGTGNSDDELSTNFGELDLEALSRLDGRRWSNCRSQDGSEIMALNGDGEEDSVPENSRSLSQKYKPMFFDELIGQSIVVQSLCNAISRGRIAPVYLFQGPRGTGKTSTARIFAAALNCLATEESKPCGYCKECTEFVSGKSKDLWEVDGTNRKGIDKVRYLLKNLSARPPVPSTFPHYKVFIIDECHLLPSKTWLTFLKFVENPPRQVVFIFITTDSDNVPRTVQSRCQKYLFNKIKDSDMVGRLRKISADENLDVELEAFDLIALNADGSLRDAETMLDQLSLLGKRITTSLVNELVGVVSDEKLLDLLELAMSSDTAETVKRARELMDSGVDPLVLMSQLASLIMDIIAGTYKMNGSNCGKPLFGGRILNEAELERLKHALKLLSDAEKQLRVSNERSTWFTATLLQLGSVPSPECSQSLSSRRQSSRTTEEELSVASREYIYRRKSDGPLKSASPATLLKQLNGDLGHKENVSSQINDFISKMKASHEEYVNGCNSDASFDDIGRNTIFKLTNFEKLNNIWQQCMERCHSKTLRQLLHAHGKLVSIAEAEGILVAYVAFGEKDIKSRAERFLSSITNSIEIVVRQNVEVRIIFLPNGESLMSNGSLLNLPELSKSETALATRKERREGHQESLKVSRGSFNDVEGKLKGGKLDDGRSTPLLDETHRLAQGSSELMDDEADETNQKEVPMQRIESIIREQRLETAWLQAAEKGTPGSLNRLRPEKNQVLPQEGSYDQHQMESVTSTAFSPQRWEDELSHDLKILKITDGKTPQKDNVAKTHYPASPSLLHDSGFAGTFNMESLVYESASGNEGCGKLFCWNSNRPRRKEKANRTAIRSRRSGRFSLFGRCGRQKSGNRLRRQAVE